MRFSRFFIDRPIFAAVIATVVTILGAICYTVLPIAQYPEVVPPTVQVTATYPGASAETVAETVAAPIEQEINGVDGMLYQSSQSTGDGRLVITATFKQGTNLDTAQNLVQNRVATAVPRLPEPVQRLGVVTKKTAPDILLAINLISPDHSLDEAYISNYAVTRIRDELLRVEGVGDAELFGSRELSMRVWLDPRRAAALGLTAGDIVSALRNQNVQVAAGTLGQPPSDGDAFQLNVQTQGRFTQPSQFADVVIRTDPDGRQVRVSDVATVQFGAEDYGLAAYLGRQKSVVIRVVQLPGSNALAAAEGVRAAMARLARQFPPGLTYRIAYDPTEFIRKSIDEVVQTLVEAVLLVTLVVIVFLQKWRAAIIPVLAIPVSLVGTAIVLAGVGYSLNNLSLFGLVLAIGIVVDDAIVVVENVERHIEQGKSSGEAARISMDEVSGALVGIVLVLCAVFLPTLFMSGLSGAFYQQFAVTISTATVISLLVSLTLSPALARILLEPHRAERARGRGWRMVEAAGTHFNAAFSWASERYARLTARLVRRPKIMLLIYGGLISAAAALFWITPVGFVPAQDQGYFIAAIQLPPGSSAARTQALLEAVSARVLPIPGIRTSIGFAGVDGPSETRAASSSAAFFMLDDYDARARRGQTLDTLIDAARSATADLTDAKIMIVKPPLIRGIGSAGGYRLMVEDQNSAGYRQLEQASNALIARANATPGLTGAYTFFDTATPRVTANIDRVKAQMLGVPPERVFEALQVYLGSAFVNDFNLLGRTFRVTAQADAAFRRTKADIANLQTRSDSGAMVPIGSVATFGDDTGPYRVMRYNLHPAVAVDGDTQPGTSSGAALAAMERAAGSALPGGFSYEWTGIAFQQHAAGNTALLVLALSVVFVFLALAAQYESFTLPLAVILIVPMCLFSAMAGVNLRGLDNNVLTQIGLVVLIALAAKNAILIVEFARQAEAQGASPQEAAVIAARERLRPILMTSFAFVLGTLPLLIAAGAGAELRQALGTAVFFGMLGVTAFGLLFTPTFYVVCRRMSRRPAGRRDNGAAANPMVK
ncbi:efflux RND transporter permease subunit [Burkholderia sp. Ac-20379]|uniref:efflux RND transporter permease subunit n=1 Tax=Burkholderia sp. Ac-20379 TaxID=2703900 RepID=UPI00197E61EC|nr:multidrug efflux RND transporter permease subunit [Burkholderia sp. Ac-20379]MBN3723686.1 efflux RND transporter permease subunit [Burkholderia sp. Ac-20379]